VRSRIDPGHDFAALVSPQALEQYLHGHIPLSRAMQAAVLELTDEGVVLGAPLEPNLNHQYTVFGGSACALAILAAWSLLHCRLSDRGLAARLVIQRHSMTFERPMTQHFTARAFLTQAALWSQFQRTMARRGKARIAVSAHLRAGGEDSGYFAGDFVALKAPAGLPDTV
jgi:thioesterase domain-containing protein